MQKGKEQAAHYSPLLFLQYKHSLKTCVASLLHTNVQVENFQTCKSAFACAIISVRSQIWHTLSWANPRQVGVHLCTLLYRTVWSTIVQDFYFKPMQSEWKHKYNSIFKGVLSCSAVSEFSTYGLQSARLLLPWGFSRQEYWSGLPCPI